MFFHALMYRYKHLHIYFWQFYCNQRDNLYCTLSLSIAIKLPAEMVYEILAIVGEAENLQSSSYDLYTANWF